MTLHTILLCFATTTVSMVIFQR